VTKADKERQQRVAKFYRERAATREATEKTAKQFGIKLPKKRSKFAEDRQKWRQRYG
jgi:hypothetical protein